MQKRCRNWHRVENGGTNMTESGIAKPTVLGVDIMAFRKRPTDKQQIAILECGVTTRLIALLENDLRPGERRSYSAGEWNPAVVKRFDEIILKEARVLGWRIFISRPVQTALAVWWEKADRNGPSLFQRLGDALAFGARVIHDVDGKSKLPIDDRNWYQTKQDGVLEIRSVLRRYKTAFAGRKAWPRRGEARAWFERTLEQAGGEFQFLHTRRISFLRYLDHIVDSASAQRLYHGEITPAELFDGCACRAPRFRPYTLLGTQLAFARPSVGRIFDTVLRLKAGGAIRPFPEIPTRWGSRLLLCLAVSLLCLLCFPRKHRFSPKLSSNLQRGFAVSLRHQKSHFPASLISKFLACLT
jgi:hypothetical protein